MPPLPPPPAGSESAVISTFDDMKATASYGSWISTSDSENGGKSTGSIQVVEGGANNSKGALRVSGEIVAGAPFPYSGVMFVPGASVMDAVNLSSKKTISSGQRATARVMPWLFSLKATPQECPPSSRLWLDPSGSSTRSHCPRCKPMAATFGDLHLRAARSQGNSSSRLIRWIWSNIGAEQNRKPLRARRFMKGFVALQCSLAHTDLSG
jgi:hypothetical protein